MSEIITIGETMAAFTPKSTGYLHYIKDYELRIAGAESNLAIGVCKLGHSASWVSRLGKDEFGYFVNNSIRAEGVDTRYVCFDEKHRTGVMFKQVLQGKETSVFYYRENSAASFMQPKDLQPEMFTGGKILHLTGITPVLSPDCEKVTEQAVCMGSEAGLKLSFDPNIRRKLWKDKDYTGLLRKIMDKTAILMLGLEEAEALYHTTEKERIAEAFFAQDCAEYLAIKDGANGAYVADREQGYDILPYPCKPIDPIGAGDAFNAGFLCALLEKRSVKEAGKMAAVAGALATESYGDIEGYPTAESMRNILDSMDGKAVDTQIYR
ncbi:MAG: sugar kinase [Clostridium sp.]|nr:sugar kinase [Clostridium sp.]